MKAAACVANKSGYWKRKAASDSAGGFRRNTRRSGSHEDSSMMSGWRCVCIEVTKPLYPVSIKLLICFDAQLPQHQMAQNRTRVSRHVPAEGRLVAA